MLWTIDFWKGAAERALKTAAQVIVAMITVGTTGLLDIDWPAALSVAGAAALASLLTSVANPGFVAGTPAPSEGSERSGSAPGE